MRENFKKRNMKWEFHCKRISVINESPCTHAHIEFLSTEILKLFSSYHNTFLWAKA
jgi:hypothetical protein